MFILGLSCFYHDSSAALLKDGVIVAAAEEERFTRKKHDSSFPLNAINYCLSSQGITINEIAYIGFYEKPILKFERLLSQYLETFPKGLWSFISTLPIWFSQKLRLIKIVRKKLKYKGSILFVPHHLAHAASAFLISPFQKAAILTIDGVGEWSTTTYGIGEGNKIKLLKQLVFPHSLGLLYSAITAYLGFKVNNCEYKVMGLSAYGEKNKNENQYYKKLKNIIDIKTDGSFCLDMDYFSYCFAQRMPSKKLGRLLGLPIRKTSDALTQSHKDIAAALQMITEEAIIKITNHLYKETMCENLVLAGGVALNSVCNGKILKNTPFKNIWIQPNASDGGTSIGAISYIYNSLLGNARNYQMKDAFLGPAFSNEEIKDFLNKEKISYRFLDDNELVKLGAKLIFENKIIGWFQGGMEWGPRALGNRSILANPLNPEMKNILNSRIKHRELFRPFAPAVCEESVSTYFECDNPLPEAARYMLLVYPIKEAWRSRMPAITHFDGTGRLQAVNKDQNPLFYRLIEEFKALSGFSVILNTSFNTNNEPIVCTPSEAWNCAKRAGLDYLVIGNFLIKLDEKQTETVY